MIHFFGDSFTYGQGCTPDHEYYQRTYNGTQKTWVELTSKHLDTKFKNYGMPGVGNQKIIDSIIHNLSYIKDGDVVIIGRADDSRFTLPIKLDKYDFNGYTNILVGMLIEKRDSFNRWSDEYYNAVLDYTKYVLIPHIKIISQRWDSLYNSFEVYFNSRNVKIIMWNVEEQLRCSITGGAKYPIISDEEIDINDGHWSWNGHTQFFKQYIQNLL